VTTNYMGMSKTSVMEDGAVDVEEVVVEPATNLHVVEDIRDSGARTSCSGVEFYRVLSVGAVTGTLQIGSESRADSCP
jgi:hypothetical protein